MPAAMMPHDAEQQRRRQHADKCAQPRNVRAHDQRVHRLDAGACAQPQQQHTRAAEQRDRKRKPQKAVRAERAEILPQFLSGHIPRAEKAPGKGQTQPQSTDFPLHTIFPPMTTAKIDDTEYSIYCVQFQDAAA